MVWVLVPQATVPDAKDSYVIRAMRDSYCQVFNRHEMNVVPVWPGMGERQLGEAFTLADGIFFMGGGDVDPVIYGHLPHAQTACDDLQRTTLEFLIARASLAYKSPTLGICKGMQLMAVADGGVLDQHLPDMYAEDHGGHKTANGYATTEHGVDIIPGTLLFDIFRERRMMINSAHHQAVRSLPSGYHVSARTVEGVVEAFESTDPDHFYVGVQWHPERMGVVADPLFAAFAEQCIISRSQARRRFSRMA